MIFKILIKSKQPKEIIDVTDQVGDIVKKAKVTDGLLTIFAKHTTCAFMISEMSTELKADVLRFISLGQQLGPYSHDSANTAHAPSHFMSSIIGQSRSVPIEKGQMLLGTWQRLALLELDGPKERELIVQITK